MYGLKDKDGNNIKKGDQVSIAGYPGDKEYGSFWLGKGKVVMKEGNLLTLDAYAAPGNLGSPIYDKAGNIIAVINAMSDMQTFIAIFGDSLEFIKANTK